ncbi:olfactory receptor 4D9-like [Liasis olivaceus]
MEVENNTARVTEFVFVGFVGFSPNPNFKYFFLIVLPLVYMTACLGNLLIIITVISDHHLHVPMYFLLATLAFLDISESSVTAPKLLQVLFSKQNTISFSGCLTQIFFFHFIGGMVTFFLVAMAADRFLAISKPLQYIVIMNRNTFLELIMAASLFGFVHSIIQVILILQLPFCGPNLLDNFYCDVPQVVKLACTDIYQVELLMVFNNGLLTTLAFIALLISYSVILFKIRNHVSEGQHKALSTCAAQVTVVSLHFIPCIFIYARPFKKSRIDMIVSLLYTLVSPMLNPIIYTLRNNEMKNAIRRLMLKFFSKRIKNVI